MTKHSCDLRYASNWPARSRSCRATTGHLCCLCRKRRATNAHHAMYRDILGRVAGREIAGIHIFPLCNRCHEKAHSRLNWIQNRQDFVWGNRNQPHFYWKLIRGYLFTIISLLIRRIA